MMKYWMNCSARFIVSILVIGISCFSCSSKKKDVVTSGELPNYKHPDKDVTVHSREKKSVASESVLQFLLMKESLDKPASDQQIKQMIVKVTSNRSLTEPEVSKLMLITGTLYEDLGETMKAQEYYHREVELADKVLSKDPNIHWYQSKIEALIMLNDQKSLEVMKQRAKSELSKTDWYDMQPWFDVTKDELFKHYSFKVMSNEKFIVQ